MSDADLRLAALVSTGRLHGLRPLGGELGISLECAGMNHECAMQLVRCNTLTLLKRHSPRTVQAIASRYASLPSLWQSSGFAQVPSQAVEDGAFAAAPFRLGEGRFSPSACVGAVAFCSRPMNSTAGMGVTPES
jgi:hypothetical protein